MRINISEVLQNELYYDTLNILGKKIFDFKLKYVIDRLLILDEEMLIEEQANAKANILLTMDAENIDDFVSFRGYSPKLSERITGCFSSGGREFFEDEIFRLRDSFLN